MSSHDTALYDRSVDAGWSNRDNAHVSLTAEELQARDDVDASLKELDSVVQALIHQRDLTRAVHFSLRALDIRRRFYGLGSFEFEEGRIQTSFLIVEAARVHQSNDRFKETAELLAHVDRMTEHTLPNTPALTALDRCRRVARLAMMKELLIARYRQGRHRSALTFGRHVLELARETMCLYELPTLHLNIASVHSMLGQHKEALRHCYVSFQKVCLILEAHEDPDRYPFVTSALSLEDLDKRGVDMHTNAFSVFLNCCSLVGTEMGEEVDMDSVAPSFKAPTSSGGSECLTAERRRWGGALALAFRNMAAEQEHLMMLDGALLTYKVAHTTALSCLGTQHPVSQQCEQALRDAEASAKARSASMMSSTNDHGGKSGQKKKGGKDRSQIESFLHRNRGGRKDRVETPVGTVRANMTSSAASRTPDQTRGSKATSTPLRRPAWNDWFNSDLPVPMHHEERLRNAARRGHQRPCNRSLSSSGVAGHGSVDVSIIPEDSFFHAASQSHRADIAQGRDAVPRSVSPLPPRPSTTSFGDMSGHSVVYGRSAPPRPQTADDAFPTTIRSSSLPGADNTPVEPISLEDFSFLQNTFKLRYDINFNRPNWRFGAGGPPSRMMKREKKELGALKEERRAADALAAELGVPL